MKTDVTILLCTTCGDSISFESKAPRKRKSVLATCRQCGATVKVSGAVSEAEVEVDEAELRKARQNAIEPSAHPDEAPERTTAKDGDDTEWVWLRARMTKEQREVFQRAMKAAKLMLEEEDGIKDKKRWHGQTVEYIGADFLSGIPSHIAEKLDDEEDSEDDAA